MIDPYKNQVQLNIKKAIGTLNKLQKMIDEDRYCIDIAQQCNATIGLLRNANNKILESHLHTCGEKLASKNSNDKEQFIKEIIHICSVTNR